MIRLDELAQAQPAPVRRPGGVSMHDVAMALHRLRKAHGLNKYASLLQAMNGRSAGIDRLQESLDGLVYDLQVVVEQAALTEAMAAFREYLAEEAPHYLAGFDHLLCADALAVRADAIAGELIRQAAPERTRRSPEHPERPGSGQVGASAPGEER